MLNLEQRFSGVIEVQRPAPCKSNLCQVLAGQLGIETAVRHDHVGGIPTAARRSQVLHYDGLDAGAHLRGVEPGRDFPFESVLVHLQALAETVNPHVPPAAATEMWKWIVNSPCGKRLKAEDRRWIDLFEAIGRRDAGDMVIGVAFMRHHRIWMSYASQVLFLGPLVDRQASAP